MALVGFPGTKSGFIGPTPWGVAAVPTNIPTTLDAANEALIMIGHVETSDEGSHTINTTGSSSIAWRSGNTTFANAGTTVKVGIAAVLTTVGPPGRAANTSDVITFDVSKSLIGNGGGIITDSWLTHVPDSGSKTIAHGDLVAICIQMTARGGTDSVNVTTMNSQLELHRPLVTSFTGAAYAITGSIPNAFITFSDGATGWLAGGDVHSVFSTRTWNSSSASKEYGQLYQMPFPLKIYGAYGWLAPAADLDIVLYSDPLGTPVAEKTVSIDANTVGSVSGRRFRIIFSSPYSTTANQAIGVVFKPGASNISTYYKTLGAAGHRVSDPWGTSGYGITRASGAFANANLGLDHYYLGLIVGAFDAGGAAGRAVQVNDQSLVGA